MKCDENSGPVTELKVGTEDNQHVVAVEPRDAGKGSTFALVYVHTRGKQRRYLGVSSDRDSTAITSDLEPAVLRMSVDCAPDACLGATAALRAILSNRAFFSL